METTVIEHLRIECADEWVQSPSLREEKTAICGYSSMRTEDVVEGGDVDTVGMASLYRLLELTGIPQKNYALRGLGDRENVRERHLRGFVDNEHVDGTLGVGPRPKPSCSASDLAVRMQSIEECRIIGS